MLQFYSVNNKKKDKTPCSDLFEVKSSFTEVLCAIQWYHSLATPSNTETFGAISALFVRYCLNSSKSPAKICVKNEQKS